MVFNGLSAGVAQLKWQPGDKFTMVTVSIDPKEEYQLAAAKQENYSGELATSDQKALWHFLVGDSSQSATLAGELGFKYFYDAQQDEYAHPAVAFILTEEGVISRYLYGIDFKPQDLKLALLEASNGKIGTTIDRLLLYCFHYDPEAGAYTVFAGNVMRIGGGIAGLILFIFLGTLFAKERFNRRKDNRQTTPIIKPKMHG